MIKVAIVGAGFMGRKRADSIRTFGKGSDIVGICDIDLQKAEELVGDYGGKAYKNWESLITNSEIDSVIVATPNKCLKEISIAALENNKNVLCEKPLGKNAKEAGEICQKAKKIGKILKTGFNHRHHPAIFRAKGLVEHGSIGDLYFIRCIYGHGGRPGYEKEWRAKRELCGGGELLDQGVHIVDLFRWFLGEFEKVYGQVNTYYWNMEVEDNAFALFKTRNGQTAVMHTSWTQWKNKFIVEIFGEKGYLIVDGLGGSYGTEKLIIGKRKIDLTVLKGNIERSPLYIGGPPDEEIIEFPGPDISWQEEWKEFVSAIKENREPLGSGHDGLMANKLIEAVYKSASLNKLIKIA